MLSRTVKVSVLGLAVVALLVAPASAQLTWSGGVKGGINLAKLFGSDAEEINEFRIGFVGGGFVTADVNENFGLQGEVLYTQKGGKLTEGSAEAKFKADYIEIPVLAVGKFPAGEKAVIKIFGGPAFAFLVSAKGEVSGTGDPMLDGEEDLKDETKSFDLGIMAGASVDILVHEKASIVVAGGYNFGVLKIDDTTDEANVRNGVLGFTAGVVFPFGTSSP